MVNKVIIVGHLGADPEMRYTPGGTAVAKFRVATTERYKDANGEAQERTEWHRVVAFHRLAEICGEYLVKGRQVFLEGSLRTSSWEDKDGQTRYATEVVAREMKMLGRKEGDAGGGGRPAKPASGGKTPPAEPPDDFQDDIPF